MNTTTLVDESAIIFSIAVKVFLVHQIWVTHKRKSVDGLSIPSFIIGFISYVMLAWSGALHGYMPNIIGQTPGAILGGIIAWQIVVYDTLPRYGLRTNPWGHFTANKTCRRCRDLLVDLGSEVLDITPSRCDVGRCHGLVHIQCDRSDGNPRLIGICDRCSGRTYGLTCLPSGVGLSNDFYLKPVGEPWRAVTRSQFLAARGDSGSGGGHLSIFMHEFGSHGVVVPQGTPPPKEDEPASDYRERVGV